MRKYLEQCTEYLLYALIFLLPWQTRWIWFEDFLNHQHWEYGSFSLYSFDIMAALLILATLVIHRKRVGGLLGFLPLLGSIMLVAFLSIFQSQDLEISWYACGRLLEALALLMVVVTIRFSFVKAAFVFISAGVIQSVLGLVQFFSQHISASKWFGLASHDPGVLGDFVVETSSGRWLRAYGSFPHPNVLGGFLVICLLLLLYFFLHLRWRPRAYLRQVLPASVALVLMLFGLALTFSRSAWITLAAVLGVFLAIELVRKNRFRLRVIAVVVVTATLVCATLYALVPEVWQVRAGGGRLEAQSAGERIGYYAQAGRLIKELWYQGTGIGSYTSGLYNRDTTQNAWDYQPVHNLYVLVTAELGIFGGLIFFLLVLRFFYKAYRSLRRLLGEDKVLITVLAVTALIVLGLFDHYLWTAPSGLLLFWIIFGMWIRYTNEKLWITKLPLHG